MKKPYQKTSKKISKFKSLFEATFAKHLESLGFEFGYETTKLKYTKEHVYSLDFNIKDCILIETKGYFKPSDRQKMLDVRKSHPDLDIRFVFMANQKLHKLSNTRYGDWCEKHGFKYVISKTGELPLEWVKELKKANESKDNIQRNKKRQVSKQVN